MSSVTALRNATANISFGQLTSEAWRLYKPNARLLIGSFLTMIGAWAVLEFLVMRGNDLGALFNIVLHLIYLILAAGLEVGFLKIALNLNDGRPVEYRMLFSDLQSGPKFLAAQLIVFLMVVIGLVFFLVPGIYLGARFGLFGTEMTDRGAGIAESFSRSTRLTAGRRMELAILGVYLIVLNFFGAIFLGIGLLFTVPLSVLMVASVYRKLAGPAPEHSTSASPLS